MVRVGSAGRGLRVSVVLAWLVATGFGLAVAALTKIGPVLLMVSSRHGVHAGDVVAFAGAYLAAAGYTVASRMRGGSRRGPDR